MTALDSSYNNFMFPVLIRCSLLSIVGDVVMWLALFFVGNRIIDSKMKTNFQITSILCMDGIIGMVDVVFGVVISTRSRRWYKCIILVWVFLLIFSQMFCRKGGGVIFRLFSHVNDSFHWCVDVGGTGIASVILSTLFLSVYFVFLWCVLVCLVRVPLDVKMLVTQVLQL